MQVERTQQNLRILGKVEAPGWVTKMKMFQVNNTPWLSEKANKILLWRKALRIYKDEERKNNSDLTNEDQKTHNEMNHHELESAGINNNKTQYI